MDPPPLKFRWPLPDGTERVGSPEEFLEWVSASEEKTVPDDLIDFDLLRQEVRNAARLALTAIRREHPDEQFYAFALCPLEDLEWFCLAAGSEESLRRRAEEYCAELGGDLQQWLRDTRWDAGGWAYRELPASPSLDGALAILARWAAWRGEHHLDPDVQHRVCDRILRTFIEALQELDREGFFGTGAARDGITLFILKHDRSDWSEELEIAHQLNPKAAYEPFAEFILKTPELCVEWMIDAQSGVTAEVAVRRIENIMRWLRAKSLLTPEGEAALQTIRSVSPECVFASLGMLKAEAWEFVTLHRSQLERAGDTNPMPDESSRKADRSAWDELDEAWDFHRQLHSRRRRNAE
jgi:hypothetical protein